jgi:predicted small lipoprotein YifL
MSRPRTTAIVLILAALALAACGKVGELERPAPLWGDKAKADYEAQRKADADAQARKDAQDRATRGHPAPLPDSGPSAGPSDPQPPQ